MSGGEALATLLARDLGCPVLGREVVLEAAAAIGVPEETLGQKFERSPGLWGRLTSDRRVYVVAVQAALAEHAATGRLVYHGLAGHLLLKGVPAVLRARLIAPLEMRVRTVMERQGLGRSAAVEYIENVDEDRVRWTRFIYGVDWRDPAHYDLVVNLENISIPAAGEIIARAASRVEYAITPPVLKALADFRLACRVKVALAVNPQTRGIDLKVRADGGALTVEGDLPAAGMLTRASRRDEEEVLRTAREVPGVVDVALDLRRYDPSL